MTRLPRRVVDPRFGLRMRVLREQRGLSLRDLERPTLSSKSKLHKIETGATAPSLDTARLIDEALGAGGELVAMARGEGTRLGRSSVLEDLRAVLATRRWPHSSTLDVLGLEAETATAHETYQRADYAAAAAMLPAIVAAAEQLAVQGDGPRAHRVLALANLALSKLAAKLDDGPLAWVTADRAASAALLAEDRVLRGAAAYQVGCGLMKTPGRLGQAAEVLAAAGEDLDRAGPARDPQDLSVRGALRLLAAVVAARWADRTAAAGRLAEAEALAGQLGRDGNHLWTGFGPTNVLIHRMGVAVELEDPLETIRLADRVDTERLPPPLQSRRAQVHLELAAAFAQAPAGDAAAVLHLLEAERIAPQLMAIHHLARSVIAQLMDRERRAATPGLRALARRAGVLA